MGLVCGLPCWQPQANCRPEHYAGPWAYTLSSHLQRGQRGHDAGRKPGHGTRRWQTAWLSSAPVRARGEGWAGGPAGRPSAALSHREPQS